MNPNWPKVKELFSAALELEPQDRVSLLRKECVADEGLRAEVLALLSADEAAGHFIQESAIVDVGLLASDETNRSALTGQQIGSYKIIRELGRGGMGAVYLAARADESFDKQVALKLIKRGMDSDAIIKRFVMERQILANLDHQNIARLIDGGTTEDGLPYFVLEYVEGTTITRYCDEHRLNTMERLKLFRLVCAAVEFAHQNLIVHRDLKPSNIIVTKDGTPKLLDFGIAKLLSGSTPVETTATIGRVLTPEYASPEELRGLPVTTQSDVYSLGVVLYELLSGHRPFKFESRSPEDVARKIATSPPIKPSAVITRIELASQTEDDGHQSQTPEAIARRRDGNIEKLRRRLASDLDNIVLKALRKEPERRYASVQEFAADIRRHLEGLPVTASPDTFSYRAGKFIQRNRAAVLAAAAVLVTLFAATAITTWQARVARRERDKAERRFNQVRKLANTVVFKYHDGIEKLPGSTPVRQMLVHDALDYLDNLSTDTGSDQTLQRELAAAYGKLGDVQGNPFVANLGDAQGALDSYRKALAIREQLFKENPANAQTKYELGNAYMNMGDILWGKGENTESLLNYRRALTVFTGLSNDNPENLQYRERISAAFNGIGHVQEQSGDFQAALDSYRNMLAQAERLFAAEPANRDYRRDVAIANLKLADALHDVGDYQTGLECYQKSSAMFVDLASSDNNNARAVRDLAVAYGRVAYEYAQLKEYERAIEFSQKTIALQKQISAADPQNIQLQFDLATSYGNLGDDFRGQRRFEAAATEEREAIRIFKEALRKDPGHSQGRGNLAVAYQTLGEILAAEGDANAALGSYREALALFEAEPIRSAKQRDLALCYEDIGDLRSAKGDLKAAQDRYEESLAIWKELERLGKLNREDKSRPNEVSEKIAQSNLAIRK